MEELFGWFLKKDTRYILFLQPDGRGDPVFMAVSREIPRFLHDSLWDRGFPSILTSGTLKAGNGFVRTRQMTGLEKKKQSPGVCSRIPILLQRELSALYSWRI